MNVSEIYWKNTYTKVNLRIDTEKNLFLNTRNINKIKIYCENQKLWISINETKDSVGQYVTNVIIGILKIKSLGIIYLLDLKVLEIINCTTIAKLLDKSIHILWSQGIKLNNIFLFLSDSPPYIIKAGRNIKIMYFKMEQM